MKKKLGFGMSRSVKKILSDRLVIDQVSKHPVKKQQRA